MRSRTTTRRCRKLSISILYALVFSQTTNQCRGILTEQRKNVPLKAPSSKANSSTKIILNAVERFDHSTFTYIQKFRNFQYSGPSNHHQKINTFFQICMEGVSQVIHVLLDTKILTFVLALFVWLNLNINVDIIEPKNTINNINSTSRRSINGVSLILFLCCSDIINTIIKWHVRRPRPFASYESPSTDYSFPSAHTQFYSGLAFLFSSTSSSKLQSTVIGLFVGITRIYLGYHWASDTIFGLCLGAFLGLIFGALLRDPHLLRSTFTSYYESNPFPLAFIITTFISSCLLYVLYQVSYLDPKHQPQTASATTSEKNNKAQGYFFPFIIQEEIGAIVTIWFTLMLTFTSKQMQRLPPTNKQKPPSSVTIGVGFIGYSILSLLKKKMQCKKTTNASKNEGKSVDTVSLENTIEKGLFYFLLNLWTFLGTPIMTSKILNM